MATKSLLPHNGHRSNCFFTKNKLNIFITIFKFLIFLNFFCNLMFRLTFFPLQDVVLGSVETSLNAVLIYTYTFLLLKIFNISF